MDQSGRIGDETSPRSSVAYRITDDDGTIANLRVTCTECITSLPTNVHHMASMTADHVCVPGYLSGDVESVNCVWGGWCLCIRVC